MAWKCLNYPRTAKQYTAGLPIFFFTVNICIKQKDSILLTWVCSVMGLDRRGHQNNGQNISDTLVCGLCAAFLFLPHFDDMCDLLLPEQTHGDMESVC